MSKRRNEQLSIPNYAKRRRRLTSRADNADPTQDNLQPDDELDPLTENDRLATRAGTISGSLNRQEPRMFDGLMRCLMKVRMHRGRRVT